MMKKIISINFSVQVPIKFSHGPSARNYNLGHLIHVLDILVTTSYGKTALESYMKSIYTLQITAGINTFLSSDSSLNKKFEEFGASLKYKDTSKRLASRLAIHQQIKNMEKVNGSTLRDRLNEINDMFSKKPFLQLSMLTFFWKKDGYISEHPHWTRQSSIEKFVKDDVPYGSIRTYINNQAKQDAEQKTKQELFNLVGNQFCWIVDADANTYRNQSGIGVLTQYEKHLRNYHERRGVFPDVSTTGYLFSDNLRGSQADMQLRFAMSQTLPGSVYFPEPNLMVKASSHFGHIETGFGPGKGGMEARRLISNLREIRPGFKSAFFDPADAITTGIKLTKKKYSGHLYSEDINQLTKVPQTHLAPLNGWAHNVYQALPKVGGNFQNISGYLCTLYQFFNPIYLTQDVSIRKRPNTLNQYNTNLCSRLLNTMNTLNEENNLNTALKNLKCTYGENTFSNLLNLAYVSGISVVNSILGLEAKPSSPVIENEDVIGKLTELISAIRVPTYTQKTEAKLVRYLNKCDEQKIKNLKCGLQAKKVLDARGQSKFSSLEDFQKRTSGVGEKTIDKLKIKALVLFPTYT